jgi:drug/metabolite transporter (DMT)-like permease
VAPFEIPAFATLDDRLSALTVENRAPGICAAIAAVSIWAAWIPITRAGVTATLSPLDVAAVRFATSALLLLPLLALRWRSIPWRKPIGLFWLTAGAGTPYMLAFGYGLKVANSGQGAVLGPGANSMIVAVIAAFVLGERYRAQRMIGIAVISLGVAIVLLSEGLTGGERLWGFAMILGASTLWAAHTVASRSLHLDPWTTATVVCCLNAAALLPFYIAMGGLERLAAAPANEIILQAVFQGVITAILAMVLYAYAVRKLGASGASVFPPLSPVLAAAFGFLLLGDPLELPTAIGLLCVLAGVLIAARSR